MQYIAISKCLCLHTAGSLRKPIVGPQHTVTMGNDLSAEISATWCAKSLKFEPHATHIYIHKKNQSMLYYSLGPSDIFVMKMSVISANWLSHFFLDLTLMIFGEHIKSISPGIFSFSNLLIICSLKHGSEKNSISKST